MARETPVLVPICAPCCPRIVPWITFIAAGRADRKKKIPLCGNLYVVYFTFSRRPNVHECHAYDDIGDRTCLSSGAPFIATRGIPACTTLTRKLKAPDDLPGAFEYYKTEKLIYPTFFFGVIVHAVVNAQRHFVAHFAVGKAGAVFAAADVSHFHQNGRAVYTL